MHPRSLPLAAVTFAALATTPVAAAGAASPWGPPQTLSSAVTNVARSPSVLATGAGDTIVPFSVGFAIPAAAGTSVFDLAIARRPAGAAAFGPRVRTTTRFGVTRVLAYGQSRVIVVSQGGDAPSNLRVRFGSADGTLGPVQRVSGGENVLRFAAAANARGDTVIAFISQRPPTRSRPSRQIVMVVRRSAGKPFGTPQTIVGRGRAVAVATAINASGDIAVAYAASGRVRTRSRPAGARWQPVDDIGPSVASVAQLRLALGPRGRAVLAVFEQLLTEGGDNGPGRVLAAVREAGHRFGSAQLVDSFPERYPGFEPGVAEVALDGPRGALLAWTGRVGTGFGVRVATLDGTRFGPRRDVSPAGQQLDGLAVGDGGRATVVWTPLPGDPPAPGAVVGAAVRAPGASAFGPPELVSGVETRAEEAAVGYAPSSAAPTVAWVAGTGAATSAVRVATRATP